MNAVVPDYVEPFAGWRVWRVGGDGGLLRLLSVVHETVWPLREELRAECLRRRFLVGLRRGPPHEPPAEACTCGIYATDLEGLGSYLTEGGGRGTPYVFGRVRLWGTVAECERGWRASRAYPAELFIPTPAARSAACASADAIARALGDYAVPVVALPLTPLEALQELVREHRRLRSAR